MIANVVGSNPSHGEVYSIQHYAIKLVNDLNIATGRWFSPCTSVSSANKTDLHEITEILLKVALNTISQSWPKTQINKIDFIFSHSYYSYLEYTLMLYHGDNVRGNILPSGVSLTFSIVGWWINKWHKVGTNILSRLGSFVPWSIRNSISISKWKRSLGQV